MDLVHQDCGGRVVLDVSDIIGVRCVAPTVTARGVHFGVIELFRRNGSQDMHMNCTRCSASIASKDWDEVETTCSMCQRPFELTDLGSTDFADCLCEECLSTLKGVKGLETPAKKYRNWIKLPRDFSSRPLVEVLQSVVQMSF